MQGAVKLGLIGVDEWRDEHGYAPLGVAPAFFAPTGPVALGTAFAGQPQHPGVSTPAGLPEPARTEPASPGDTPTKEMPVTVVHAPTEVMMGSAAMPRSSI